MIKIQDQEWNQDFVEIMTITDNIIARANADGIPFFSLDFSQPQMTAVFGSALSETEAVWRLFTRWLWTVNAQLFSTLQKPLLTTQVHLVANITQNHLKPYTTAQNYTITTRQLCTITTLKNCQTTSRTLRPALCCLKYFCTPPLLDQN